MSTFAPPIRRQRPPEEEEPLQVQRPGAGMRQAGGAPNLNPNQFEPAQPSPPPTMSPAPSRGFPSWYKPFKGSGGTGFWNEKAGYGTNQDQYNARTFLSGKGFAVGQGAFEASQHPNAKKMTWKELAQLAGINDFQGAKRDPRMNALQNAFYGHVQNAGDETEDRMRYAEALRKNLANKYGELTLEDWQAGGGGPNGELPQGGGQGGSLESETDALIRKLMSGKEGPYTEEVQSNMRADAAARRSADLQSQQRDAYLSSMRGSGTTGPAGAAIQAANQRAAQGGLARDVAGIRNQATQANFQAKLQGLEQAQASISRSYQDRWNKAQNETQRLQIEKEYDAAMKKIEADKEMAQQQISAANAAAGRGHAWDIENRDAMWAREDYEYQRDLPFQLLQYGMGALGE